MAPVLWQKTYPNFKKSILSKMCFIQPFNPSIFIQYMKGLIQGGLTGTKRGYNLFALVFVIGANTSYKEKTLVIWLNVSRTWRHRLHLFFLFFFNIFFLICNHTTTMTTTTTKYKRRKTRKANKKKISADLQDLRYKINYTTCNTTENDLITQHYVP